jgi:glycine/D-amino acid oxidase-like deaminating enzyme
LIKTIVIGAGVMGASVAYRLAQGGAVTVLEATRVGGGTSGTSFAWTNANKKPPKPYHDLNVAGMKAHAALSNEFGALPWWHGGGSIEWEAEPDRATQHENIARLQSWGCAAEWITARQVRELEPDIEPATIGDAPVAFFPEEGWLDPVVYAHAMLSAARRHGAKVICGARVVDQIKSMIGTVAIAPSNSRRLGTSS